MPEISLIVTLAIVVVSAIVIFRVARGVIQGALLAGAVVSILTAVAGGLVVKDALELRDNFQKGDKMLLLSDHNWTKLTAGIMINGLAADGKGGSAEALTAAELEKLNALFAMKDYGAMRGKNYKLIIITESSVTGSLPEGLDIVFIISEYKKGNAVVYPETPVFKAIKLVPLVPLSFFRKAAEKAFQQGAGVTKDLTTKAAAAASAAAT